MARFFLQDNNTAQYWEQFAQMTARTLKATEY